MTAPEPREDVAVAEVLAAHLESSGLSDTNQVAAGDLPEALCREYHPMHWDVGYGNRNRPCEACKIHARRIAPLIAERVRAAAVEAWDAGAAVGDELARERTLLWADDQMQALPEHRTPVAHGKAELLTDLRRFLYRADRRAER